LTATASSHAIGWFVACLCTPLIGEDLAAALPRYRPTSLLARETNGDLGDLIPRWRGRLGTAPPDADLRPLGRSVGRRLVRTGFTLVMPRWGGWTSDLEESAAVFARYYPDHGDQMRAALAAARSAAPDRTVLSALIDGLAPWLAGEYAAVHGRKAPRIAELSGPSLSRRALAAQRRAGGRETGRLRQWLSRRTSRHGRR
jgi:hypothetical protein